MHNLELKKIVNRFIREGVYSLFSIARINAGRKELAACKTLGMPQSGCGTADWTVKAVRAGVTAFEKY